MPREDAVQIDLSRSKRAVLSPKGVTIIEGRQAFWLAAAEVRNLTDEWPTIDPARKETEAA